MEAEKTGGFVRVVARASDHVILGVQATGNHVSELSGEFTLRLRWVPFLGKYCWEKSMPTHNDESFHEGVLKTLGQQYTLPEVKL
ncbi:MAG: hypothetical protein Ct9H90mP16_13020 [Candidatus Poseidoniales archaeon]|nr:MAG: hypothetical protein Ct9H90mP16_13020 [Candidatus Poseidoniales archaeon]